MGFMQFCRNGHDMSVTRTSNGRGWVCGECRKASRKTYNKTTDAIKRNNLRQSYGMTLESFQQLLATHDNRCAICQKSFSEERRPHVDHDHATGVVRGLLCRNCNFALGLLSDDVLALGRAIAYLGAT